MKFGTKKLSFDEALDFERWVTASFKKVVLFEELSVDETYKIDKVKEFSKRMSPDKVASLDFSGYPLLESVKLDTNGAKCAFSFGDAKKIMAF